MLLGVIGVWMHIFVLAEAVPEGTEGPIADDSNGRNSCQEADL